MIYLGILVLAITSTVIAISKLFPDDKDPKVRAQQYKGWSSKKEHDDFYA